MIGRHLEEGDVWWQLSEEGGVSPGNSGTKGGAAPEDEGRGGGGVTSSFTCFHAFVHFLPNLPVTALNEFDWLPTLCAAWRVSWGTGISWESGSGGVGELQVGSGKTGQTARCDCTKSFISRMQEHISTHGSKTDCI